MPNKPYTPNPVELRAIGKVKMHHPGYEVMHPGNPSGYSWEPVYELNGTKVVVWWYNGFKHLADISDFDRNEYGIRTKPKHYPLCLKKHYRIYPAYSDNYPSLPEID